MTLNLNIVEQNGFLFLDVTDYESQKILDLIDEATKGKVTSEGLISIRGDMIDIIRYCRNNNIDIIIKKGN